MGLFDFFKKKEAAPEAQVALDKGLEKTKEAKCVADISKAKSLLGYEPQVSLESGIHELLKWVKEQAARDKVESATAELESRQRVR